MRQSYTVSVEFDVEADDEMKAVEQVEAMLRAHQETSEPGPLSDFCICRVD